jgi:hypothetical protein
VEYDVQAKHVTVIDRHDAKFGWFGWPNVTMTDDKRLLVSTSGMRIHHMCPFGKAILIYGSADAAKWGLPMVLSDSHLDDRDVCVKNIGGGKLMATWKNWKTSNFVKGPFYSGMLYDSIGNEDFIFLTAHLRTVNEEMQNREFGSWVTVSDDNGFTWAEPNRCPINSVHGPTVMNDGSLLYIGKLNDENDPSIQLCHSADDGKTWEFVSKLPFNDSDGLTEKNFVDPTCIQLQGGRIIAHIRYQNPARPDLYPWGPLSVYQAMSDDGGKTWSIPQPLGVVGAPPHIMRHSSGALISVYGRRRKPLGISAMISLDNGETWRKEIVLRDDIQASDLGYPCSVELKDGSLFTVYYMFDTHDGKLDEKASILGTKWRIDDFLK